MNSRFTRAAAKAANERSNLPRPKRLQFSPTPKSKSNKNKDSTPKVDTPATTSTAAGSSSTSKASNKRKNKKKNSTSTDTENIATDVPATKNSPTTVSDTQRQVPSPIPPANTPPAVTIEIEEETMAARVPFPPFKTDDIEAWFRRVEHWFTFSKVTTELDKFALIASQIENPTVANLTEMLTPDADTPYTKLKKKIISIFEATTTAKINNLLSGCQLGDRKPSQLLAEMKRLGGDSSEEILRNLWTKRLPLHVQAVVASATKSTLDEVATIADAVVDVVSTPSSSICQTASSNNNQPSSTHEHQATKDTALESLFSTINELKQSFRDLQMDRSRSKSRDNQRNRDRSSSNKPAENRICRYHRKFGAKAYLCTKPCSFVPVSESKN